MEEPKRKVVFVLDVDGTLTDGRMYYTKEGKVMKSFGCDDFDALKLIGQKIHIQFVTADKRGLPIVQKRADEMGINLADVPSRPQARWNWIKEKYPDMEIIYMGDGIFDYHCLKQANFSFTVKDALDHTRDSAKIVVDRRGGDRAVAAACIEINRIYELKCFQQEDLG
jgi:3-deoxy-D-manno-octulosonate 8-phosphate phosphatase (KDO 8-P phosphatase)